MQWSPGVKTTIENPIPVITDERFQQFPLLRKLFKFSLKIPVKTFENATNSFFRLRNTNDGAQKYSRDEPEKESRECNTVDLEIDEDCRTAIV